MARQTTLLEPPLFFQGGEGGEDLSHFILNKKFTGLPLPSLTPIYRDIRAASPAQPAACSPTTHRILVK